MRHTVQDNTDIIRKERHLVANFLSCNITKYYCNRLTFDRVITNFLRHGVLDKYAAWKILVVLRAMARRLNVGLWIERSRILLLVAALLRNHLAQVIHI